ncbi:hypothetical protein OOZ54_12700 [Rhodopseudomonas palustris]|uniref:hypothetical protein n=1 Tax=Rhodopseudomonas palustris TaxID=1076 RepID=UPI0022EFF61E|nr:hypothetical protein [Rhodopseudomonas palustris]WBU27554.1 hypothetical protein OOZ54_12700 [Rhodopseudomonas palustris]
MGTDQRRSAKSAPQSQADNVGQAPADSYQAQLDHERRRAQQRLIQEAGVAWLMGYDTPQAKWFEAYIESNKAAIRASARSSAAAADPLNITRHTPEPSKRQKKREAEKARLNRGERHDVIPDPDHPNQNVLVTTLQHSFRRVKQLRAPHQPAAERFVRDWEAAFYSGLRSPGFDPRVDASARAHAGHLRAVEAQKRLNSVQRYIGERNYDICVGVLIMAQTAAKIHALGGRDHRSVNHDIDVALNALTEFYDPARLARDPTWRAFKKVIEAGAKVIGQGEEETR